MNALTIGIITTVIIVIIWIIAHCRDKKEPSGPVKPPGGPEKERKKDVERQGYWICTRCETYVPLTQNVCFLCNNPRK